MPMYARVCTACGLRFERFYHMHDDKPCTGCGSPTDTDYAAQGAPAVPAHDLHGTRALSHEVAARPSEVPALRRMYGPGVGHCWQDDGTVRFAHRDEGRKFFAADERIRRELSARKRERTQSTANKT